jgi:hypothetical protein
MNIDSGNGQSTMNQDFQFSSTYIPQDTFGLSEFEPHVTHGWLQKNSAYPFKPQTFSTSSPLCGIFPPIFYSMLNFNNHILMDASHRLKLTKGRPTN